MNKRAEQNKKYIRENYPRINCFVVRKNGLYTPRSGEVCHLDQSVKLIKDKHEAIYRVGNLAFTFAKQDVRRTQMVVRKTPLKPRVLPPPLADLPFKQAMVKVLGKKTKV